MTRGARMFAGLAAALGVGALLGAAGPAGAVDRALAPRDDSPPVVSGNQVVFGQSSGRNSVVLSSEPLAGGPPATLGRFSPGGCRSGLSAWALSGGQAGVGLRLLANDRCERLFTGPATGPLLPVAGVSGGRSSPVEVPRPVLAVPGGVLTIDEVRHQLLLHDAAGTRRIPVPRDADLSNLDASGSTIVFARVSRIDLLRSLVLLDLATGATRPVGAGSFRGLGFDTLGIGPDGSVAVVANIDRLAYAAPRAARLRPVMRGVSPSAVEPARGRIAMTVDARPTALSGGRVRVIGVPGRGGRTATIYRSPLTASVGDTLSFDGRWLGWASGSCQVLTDTAIPSSPASLPPGPCTRTEARGAIERLRRGSHALRARVRCLAAPGGRCRVGLKAIDARGHMLGQARATVRSGHTATVAVPVRGRVRLRRARRAGCRIGLLIRAADPEDRTRLPEGVSFVRRGVTDCD